MAIDLSRVASAAIAAAFEDGEPSPRRRLSGARAVAAGAALAVAARVAVKRASNLPDLSRVPDLVLDRLAELGQPGEDCDEEDLDEEYFDEDGEVDIDDEPVHVLAFERSRGDP